MVSFIGYGKQWIDGDDIKAVEKVLRSDYLTQGPVIEGFEKAIRDYTGAEYCVAVANGTAALHLAVLALDIKKESEGITTPNTFVASANALVYAGLKPVFADIEKDYFCIDPNEIKKKITDKTKVIVAVDFAGQPAQMKDINKIAKEKGIYVIEDAAHAIGTEYEDGSRVGSCKYSDITTFSFHPVKTLTTAEGGAITTSSKEIYEKLLLLRAHGITKDPKKMSQNPGPWYYEMQTLGYNYRLSEIQAALGLSQIKRLDDFVKRRREIFKRYNEAFSDLNALEVPQEREGVRSAFHLYVARFNYEKIGKPRAEFMEDLKKKNIGTQVHYIPVHLQPYYRDNFDYEEGDCPVSESYYKQALSLPLYPKMTDDEVNHVITTVARAVNL